MKDAVLNLFFEALHAWLDIENLRNFKTYNEEQSCKILYGVNTA